VRLTGLYYVIVGTNLCDVIDLEPPLNFTTACCPLSVPLLSRPFMQTLSWCLGLNHLGLWIFCAPLRDCEAVTHMHKLSWRGSLFVTRISLLTWGWGWGKCGGTLLAWTLWKATADWWHIILGLPVPS